MSAASPAAPASLRADATIISLVGFAHGTSHFFHFVLPPLFPYLMAQFGLTFTQAGLPLDRRITDLGAPYENHGT